MQRKIKEAVKISKTYAVAFLKWLFLGMVIGIACGGLGALFSKSISGVTELRAENSWLLFLLPIGGLLSVAVYRLLRVTDVGTNQVFESVSTDKKVSFLLVPAVFLGSVITHLCGGSAGREGAALQLGGGVATFMSKALRLNEKTRRILTMCGMAALFSAIFGTPLGACIFILEVIRVGSVCLAAIFPVFVSSITAFSLASFLGAEAERFPLPSVQNLAFSTLWKVLVIAVAGALISILFCHALRFTKKWLKTLFKNDFLRIFIGGAVIVLLTLALGTTDYNGGGIDVIHRIFTTGEVRHEAFLLKIIFTVITVAAGFKGGEIIPTFFIGATLGGSLAILLGLDPALGAAVGMVALFCGVTNCPLATIFLSVEMFGASGMLFFALASVTSFLLSGNISLYSGQKLISSKLI